MIFSSSDGPFGGSIRGCVCISFDSSTCDEKLVAPPSGYNRTTISPTCPTPSNNCLWRNSLYRKCTCTRKKCTRNRPAKNVITPSKHTITLPVGPPSSHIFDKINVYPGKTSKPEKIPPKIKVYKKRLSSPDCV